MKDLIGKRMSSKSDPNSPERIIHSIDNNYATFTDNSKVPMNRLDALFTESPSNTMNADDFFASSSMESVANDFMSHIQNPTQALPIGNVPPLSSTIAEASTEIIIDSQPVTNQNQIPPHIQNPTQVKTPYERLMEDDWIKDQFNNDGKMKEPSDDIRRVSSESLREDLEGNTYRPGLNTKDQTQTQTQTVIPVVASLVSESGAPAMFKNMKKNKNVKINITLAESIPNTESIKHLNDMFESDITIVEHLANEITDKVIEDPTILKKLIMESLNKMIYPKKRTTVKKQSL